MWKHEVGAQVHMAEHMIGRSRGFDQQTLTVQSQPVRGGVNYVVVRDGDPRGLKVKEDMIEAGPYDPHISAAKPYVPPTLHDCGTVVRFAHPTRADQRGLHVVTGHTGLNHRVYPLGGSTRYYTGIPGGQLVVVPLSELAGQMSA